MKPNIDETEFGYITVDGDRIEHDIMIRLSGEVVKRKKSLSKAIYGTSHTVSLDEAKYVYEAGAKQVIIGAGQDGMVSLSNEAAEFFEKKDCEVDIKPTPTAIKRWNKAKGKVIAMFHVTC